LRLGFRETQTVRDPRACWGVSPGTTLALPACMDPNRPIAVFVGVELFTLGLLWADAKRPRARYDARDGDRV
jgi:hypothetical protein